MPGERAESVFLEGWYPGLFALDAGDPFDRTFWDRVIQVRMALGPQLERFRAERNSSLDAELDLYCDDALLGPLSRLGDELRFALITSYARLHPIAERPADAVDTELEGLAVRVSPSAHPKCVRCWHHREDVGSHADHPDLCGRCVDNVQGDGEVREFA